MRAKLFLIILTLFTFSNLFAQCPGAMAQTYKNKALNVTSGNTEEGGAYSGIATYYAYKCECENGTNRDPAQLVNMINGLVDVNAQKYQNRYGTISKVTSCKELGSGGSEYSGDNNSDNTGELGLSESEWIILNDVAESIGEELVELIWGNEEQQKIRQENKIANKLSKIGIDRKNDTTTVAVSEGMTIVFKFKDKESRDKFDFKEILAYDKDGDLAITQEVLLNTEDRRVVIDSDYKFNKVLKSVTKIEDGKKTLSGYVRKSHVLLMKIDMLKGKVIYEKENVIIEDLLNDKGKKIGDREIYKGDLFLDKYYHSNGVKKREVFYLENKKYQEYFYITKSKTPIREKVIYYDNLENISRVVEHSLKDLKKNSQQVTLYKEGKPFLKQYYKKGKLDKEEIIN